jgi:sigma-B regulation protein RsbU (phosphoserine phosphatase)
MDASMARLRVLFLEDSESDIERVHQKLAGDFNCPVEMDAAAGEAAFRERLGSGAYDLILADCALPGCGAPAALGLAAALCPGIPFICMSGAVGEEAAVELLKQGAADYVLKDRLHRLSFAVLRALEGAQAAAERRQAERKLKKTVEMLEEAQLIAGVGSMEWDAASDTMTWSDEAYRICGLDPAAPQAGLEPNLSFMDECDAPRARAAWNAAVDALQPFDESFWITRPDGLRKCVRLRISVKTDAAGKLSAIVGSVQDITELKLAEEEARKRLETEARLNVMTEFFTNVSHELKTPLALILMQLDMMRVHAGNAAKSKDLIADATLNAYRLTRLVSNLLDITKMDAGFLKLNPKSRDIVALLRHIADSVREYANARNIALEFISDALTKRMDVDADKLERAVLNLLSNAIKHTPEGGRIVLELGDRGDHVVIRVVDTGAGIPEDRLGIVFDRFAQVNNRMNRQTEGCGIGLALVKSMAELYGGRVWAESKLGEGSVFTLELPVRHGVIPDRSVVVEGFDLNKKVKMELSDLYIKRNP